MRPLRASDQNLPFQQNLTGRRLAVQILPTASWPMLKGREGDVDAALHTIVPGSVVRLRWAP
jgi:hypothetical protein